MAKVSTNINLDPTLKKNAQELLRDLGMDLTTAITIFLRQTVREQGIPFEIKREIPNAQTIEALNEYTNMKEHPENYKHYASFSDGGPRCLKLFSLINLKKTLKLKNNFCFVVTTTKAIWKSCHTLGIK